MSKTIKQIADEIGVTKQAVQKRLSREPLHSEISKYIHQEGTTKYIDVEGENLIKSAFGKTSIDNTSIDKNNVSIDATIDKNNPSIDTSIDENSPSIDTSIPVSTDKSPESIDKNNTSIDSESISAVIDLLRGQLAEKDKQIASLTSQLSEANASAKDERDKERQERQTILTRLWNEENKTKSLEAELSKYKSIVDSQQVPEGESVKEEPSRDHTEPKQPEPQKRSFFKRLFGRK